MNMTSLKHNLLNTILAIICSIPNVCEPAYYSRVIFHSHNFHHMKCVTHYDYKKDFVSMSCTQNAEDKASKVTNKLCKL